MMQLVLTTTPTVEDAEALARALLESRLAACVQILPEIRSYFLWEGKPRNEAESLLLIKTLEEKFPEIEAFIAESHSYDVPEIVAVQASRVSEKYLAWLGESIRGGD